jgi:hypothetical protein
MLKNFIENIKNAALKNFEKLGQLTPVFISEINGERVIMPLHWETNEDKDTFSDFIQKMIVSGYVREYIMVTESWIAKSSEADFNNVQDWLKEHGSLKDYPNRSEAIMVQYCSKDEEIQHIADICRNGNSTVIGDWTTNRKEVRIPVVELSSRFQGLFPKSKASLN